MQDSFRYEPLPQFLVLASPPKGDRGRLAHMGFRLVEVRPTVSVMPTDHKMYAPGVASWVLVLPPGWATFSSATDPGTVVEVADEKGRFRGQYAPEALSLKLFSRYSATDDGVCFDILDPMFRRAAVIDNATMPPMTHRGAAVVWTSPDEVVAQQGDDLAGYRDRLIDIAHVHMDEAWPGWRDPTLYW